MRTFEISGNLEIIENYNNFYMYIISVMNIFEQFFGVDLLHKIDLYVDNATADTGYTPITTIVLRKYIIIKLGITDFSHSPETVKFTDN